MIQPFNRYDGALREDIFRRMPISTLRARTAPTSIGELLGHYEEFSAKRHEQRMYPWASRFVLGYPLPDWQRDPDWSMGQSRRFIASIWGDVDLGSYLFNGAYEVISGGTEEAGPSDTYRKLSFALLDGQQRLRAIENYVLNQFAVPDAQGVACYWSELGKVERRFFCNKLFAQSTIECWDENVLRQVHDLRSFGGTAHQEHQRASPVPSDHDWF
ncbi:MAG: hypothetical protein Q7U16_12615 [Agitococcus sp.]|nr:hypothetical protein [Agitococcus sp.]